MKPAYRRKKGKRRENELMDILLGDGFDMRKCDASGAGKYDVADFVLRLNKRDYTIECKGEKKLPIVGLESRKGGADILMMRENRGDWKVYMDLSILELLLLNEG